MAYFRFMLGNRQGQYVRMDRLLTLNFGQSRPLTSKEKNGGTGYDLASF